MTQQLPGGHVDAGEQRIARPQRALPGAELPRRALKNEKAEFDDQPGLLGDGDEFDRRQPAEPGWFQRASASKPATARSSSRTIGW